MFEMKFDNDFLTTIFESTSKTQYICKENSLASQVRLGLQKAWTFLENNEQEEANSIVKITPLGTKQLPFVN